jgi:cAMP-dependent protein kinase regulator
LSSHVHSSPQRIAGQDVDEAEAYEKKVVPKDPDTMEHLRSVVIGNVLFQHLEEDELTDVLDAMFEVTPKAGDEVIKQGDEGDNFYVVETGATDVLIDSGDGNPKVCPHCHPPHFHHPRHALLASRPPV